MKKKMTVKRVSVGQIRKRLELQIEMDGIVLEQQAKALPSLEVIGEVAAARARIVLCRDLLRETAPVVNKKK